MPRPGPLSFFRQSLKSGTFHADELVNIFLLRPIAAAFVWILYPTRVTPNMVTVGATLIGIAAGYVYSIGGKIAIAVGGALVMLKDILDDADGQLARAKELYSRVGRFLDSIGDFLVDVAIFIGIFIALSPYHGALKIFILSFLGLLGITLRVSYHVYYQVSFLHTQQRYGLNRIVEVITEEDRKGDRFTLLLQRVFNVIYTWQDRLMVKLDGWCMGKRVDERLLPTWYTDRVGLRLSGLIGFGTEFTLLAVCSWFDALYLYLWLNLFLMNGIWLLSILYRRLILSGNLG